MNRKAFFANLRKRDSGVFGTSLTQAQVDGINALLDSMARHGVSDPWAAALIFANVYHETGRYMLPIKETVYPGHKDKNPSDATVIARLDAAWRKGQLKWVKTPYWRDGWFGRGPVQVTHERNYRKMGKRLGVDLVKDRSLILRPDIGADSAVVGMLEGLYTGKKISDYRLPQDLDIRPTREDPKAWERHPRRIINGKDGTDASIAKYTRAFHRALVEAGGVPDAPQKPVERDPVQMAPTQPPKPETPPAAKPEGVWGAIGLAIKGLLNFILKITGAKR